MMMTPTQAMAALTSDFVMAACTAAVPPTATLRSSARCGQYSLKRAWKLVMRTRDAGGIRDDAGSVTEGPRATQGWPFMIQASSVARYLQYGRRGGVLLTPT